MTNQFHFTAHKSYEGMFMKLPGVKFDLKEMIQNSGGDADYVLMHSSWIPKLFICVTLILRSSLINLGYSLACLIRKLT